MGYIVEGRSPEAILSHITQVTMSERAKLPRVKPSLRCGTATDDGVAVA